MALVLAPLELPFLPYGGKACVQRLRRATLQRRPGCAHVKTRPAEHRAGLRFRHAGEHTIHGRVRALDACVSAWQLCQSCALHQCCRQSFCLLPGRVLPGGQKPSARMQKCGSVFFQGLVHQMPLTLGHQTPHTHTLHTFQGVGTHSAPFCPQASATLQKACRFCPDPKRSAGNTALHPASLPVQSAAPSLPQALRLGVCKALDQVSQGPQAGGGSSEHVPAQWRCAASAAMAGAEMQGSACALHNSQPTGQPRPLAARSGGRDLQEWPTHAHPADPPTPPDSHAAASSTTTVSAGGRGPWPGAPRGARPARQRFRSLEAVYEALRAHAQAAPSPAPPAAPGTAAACPAPGDASGGGAPAGGGRQGAAVSSGGGSAPAPCPHPSSEDPGAPASAERPAARKRALGRPPEQAARPAPEPGPPASADGGPSKRARGARSAAQAAAALHAMANGAGDTPPGSASGAVGTVAGAVAGTAAAGEARAGAPSEGNPESPPRRARRAPGQPCAAGGGSAGGFADRLDQQARPAEPPHQPDTLTRTVSSRALVYCLSCGAGCAA